MEMTCILHACELIASIKHQHEIKIVGVEFYLFVLNLVLLIFFTSVDSNCALDVLT